MNELRDRINKTLDERSSDYGPFCMNAHVTQSISRVLAEQPNYKNLGDSGREAIHMIAHKLARIVVGNGDKHIEDQLTDIIGYTHLWLNDHMNAHAANERVASGTQVEMFPLEPEPYHEPTRESEMDMPTYTRADAFVDDHEEDEL